MITDEEGFLYPVASSKCIHCGKCEKVCPRLNKFDGYEFEQKAYVATVNDKNKWKRSSSGGAFSEICWAFGDENTLICGAAWDGLRVKHVCVKGVDNLAPLCKSKYIASDLKDVYSELKSHLEMGGKAIFSGTPCQVAGIKAFLGKEYANLLLIDLICHGVGSPDVFEKCVELTGKQLGMTISNYGFRQKPTNYFATRYLSSVSDGEKTVYVLEDQYSQLFLKQHCLRPSCGKNCIYRNEHRQGDITIADFNGADKPFKDLSFEGHNYSSIISNTSKGEIVISGLFKRMVIYSCPIENIKKYNPLFFKQTWFSEKRDSFFEDFCLDKESIEQWVTDAKIFKYSLKRKTYDLLPAFLKKIVKKVVK
jgi:hypothetical protein